jgi:hypothetical protein
MIHVLRVDLNGLARQMQHLKKNALKNALIWMPKFFNIITRKQQEVFGVDVLMFQMV